MASRIPKEFKDAIVDLMVAEPIWKVALFQNTSNCNTNGILSYATCTNEVTNGAGTAYVAGGATLTGRIAGYINTTNVALYATNVTWSSATITGIRYAVVYETVSSNIRIVYDLAADYSVTNGTFTLTWDADGLLNVV